MPGNLLTADTTFPDLTGKGSTEEKLKAISGYLYMLLEQLRYTLNNLGQDNFNTAELDGLGKLITEPLTVRINDAEKGLTELTIQAGEISSRVDSAEKTTEGLTADYSELKQTAQKLEAKFQTGGVVAKIDQTVEGLGIFQTTDNGQSVSALSSVSLYFYDGAIKDKASGSLGYSPEKGNIIGQIKMDDQGSGSATEAKYRMFVGTGRGSHYNGIGWDETDYSLKLHSAGNSSYTSKSGNIYITPGEREGSVWHYVQIGDGNPSGNYRFQSDGLYHNGTKIGHSAAGIAELIESDAAIKAAIRKVVNG